eukprot:Gregarina_sp_Poly_1__10329@NODE_731_length_6562_cov_119_589684_g548_i0_p3_GENE_NODE_731_length_6562_cov_119_589684_g548_i0NODE_731_length_6562_cov_119_589684_g548_i0_p3_ORF_typecomplete_len391_score30_25AP2/PF00847_20/4_7e11_NODE_731_length_6562_cov_119_589684_g548_i034934665
MAQAVCLFMYLAASVYSNTPCNADTADSGQKAQCTSEISDCATSANGQTLGQWDSVHFPLGPSGFGLLDPRSNFPEGRVVGVYFDKQRRIWRANWREGGVGKRKTKNFSVDDYGFEEARRLAIQYRLLKIMEVSDKQLSGGAGLEQAALLSAELKHRTERKPDSGKGKRRRRYTLANHQLTKRTFNSDNAEWYNRAESVGGHENWGASPDDMFYLARALHWQNGWGVPVSGFPYVSGEFSQDRMSWTPPPIAPELCDFTGVLDGIPAADGSKVVTARPVTDEDSGVYFQPTLTTSSSAETGEGDDEDLFEGVRNQDIVQDNMTKPEPCTPSRSILAYARAPVSIFVSPLQEAFWTTGANSAMRSCANSVKRQATSWSEHMGPIKSEESER